jgi:TonB family protein
MMEAIFDFLTRSSIGIAGLYALYFLLLRQSTHFKANRFYLLVGMLSILLIAAFPMRYEVLLQAPKAIASSNFADQFQRNGTAPVQVEETVQISLAGILLYLYAIGSAFFFLRLLVQSWRPVRVILNTKAKKISNCWLHVNREYKMPFSFFNRILIHPEYFKQNEIDDIIAHEKVHIQERHWIDLFIIELLTVFFWFNPFIWLVERAIKQNHEYLADNGVLTRGQSPVRYQAILINQLMGTEVIGLANNLNFALGPTRFKMMTKEKTPKRKLMRMIWALPFLAILLYAFAQPEYTYKEQPVEAIPQQDSTFTVVTPENGEFLMKLDDGSSISMAPNSKIEAPKKFGSDVRKIKLEGEAYFDVADDKRPFIVEDFSGKEMMSIPADAKKKENISTIEKNLTAPKVKFNGIDKNKKIKAYGTVTDESGKPLPGASVVLQGTTKGTVVDRDGSFKLEVPANKDWALVVSYVGYKTALNQVELFEDKTDLKFKFVMKREVIEISAKELKKAANMTPPPPPPPAPESVSDSDESVFYIVEELPEYPKGFYALAKHVNDITNGLKEDYFFQGKRLNGKATVGFTVTPEGKVSNIQILDKSDDVAAETAMLVAKKMKQWSPGAQRGKKVPVDFAMEIDFSNY